MKKEVKERKIKETVYVAIDGTEFQYESECSKYENTALCVLNARYSELVVRTTDEYSLFRAGCEDNDIDVVRIKDEKDIDTVAELFCMFKGYDSKNCQPVKDFMSSLSVGVNFIWRGYDRDYMSPIGTPETIAKRIQEFCKEA